MNIFVVDADPVKAAQDLCDQHVVKMITESAQMLSTICTQLGNPGPYKPTHTQHPCTVWARQSLSNYRWLLDHYTALGQEYTRRYGKVHKSSELVSWFENHLPDLPDTGLTPFAQAMPEPYRHPDAVTAYRNYYRGEKAAMARYRHSPSPAWLTA